MRMGISQGGKAGKAKGDAKGGKGKSQGRLWACTLSVCRA